MMEPTGAQEVSLVAAAARGGALGQLVLELWQRTRIDWSYATDQLAQAFRRERGLGSRERRFVAETLYGMIRHARRLDEARVAGGLRATTAAPDRARLLAYLVLEDGLAPAAAARAIPEVDWARAAAVDTALVAEPDLARRVARRHSLPDFLAARLVADLGEQAEPLAAALNQRAPMTVRANLLATDRDGLAEALAAEGLASEPGRWSPTALQVTSRTNLFGLRAFTAGRFEAQDEGSQLVAELVAPPPRGLVVDGCAGAGGKTLAIAAALGNRGRVLATDVDARKLGELRRRARRAGATTVQATAIEADPAAPWPAPLAKVAGRVDRVLLDVPCSGVGSLRRNPEARWRLQPADLDRMPALQLAIAERFVSLLAPGGRLIYATCTVLTAENQGVVERLLAAHPELEPVAVKEVWGAARAAPLGDPEGRYLTLWPHVHGTDGFFAAVVRRRR